MRTGRQTWEVTVAFPRRLIVDTHEPLKMQPLLFWDVTQRRLVVCYRRFGTTCPSHIQGSRSPRRTSAWPLKMGQIVCPETSAKYQSTLRNIPEERRSHLHRVGCLESRITLETADWRCLKNAYMSEDGKKIYRRSLERQKIQFKIIIRYLRLSQSWGAEESCWLTKLSTFRWSPIPPSSESSSPTADFSKRR
jgi:hypothetical protein